MANLYARDTSITANNSTNPSILGANKQLTDFQTKPIQNNRINHSLTPEIITQQEILAGNRTLGNSPEKIEQQIARLDRVGSPASGYTTIGKNQYGDGRSSVSTVYLRDNARDNMRIACANGGKGNIFTQQIRYDSVIDKRSGVSTTLSSATALTNGFTASFTVSPIKFAGDLSNIIVTDANGSLTVVSYKIQSNGSIEFYTNRNMDTLGGTFNLNGEEKNLFFVGNARYVAINETIGQIS